jgi:hypothetical protein
MTQQKARMRLKKGVLRARQSLGISLSLTETDRSARMVAYADVGLKTTASVVDNDTINARIVSSEKSSVSVCLSAVRSM